MLDSLSSPKSPAMLEKVQYRKSCFNCDGEHNLRDCPRPKDFRRISKKKSESVDESRKKQRSYGSLGLSKQKQHDFEPGKLSDNLRKALGLQTNEIPEHVYRMRRLGFVKGYPPGWLRKAIKSTEIIKVFSADSTNKCEDNLMRPPELDMSKIIAYPGFNKNSAELLDREVFKVPPMETFCSEYQNELNNIFRKQRKHEKRKYKSLSKHKKFADDDEVIFVENDNNNSEASKFKTPGEENTVVLLKGNTGNENVQTPVRSNISMGQSMFELTGTPTFGNKVTPVVALEAFSVGIQPFRAGSEETESRGAFRKLMNKLGEARAQNLELQAKTEVDHDNSNTLVQSDCSLLSKKIKSKKRKTRRRNA
ncbi:hypothetical protein CAEBREN_18170 [Caenorhabditis brenneri]|uniref:PSP proline-rich domain-containing protein n=1 Tax=Caenorhabditis brenneri TaxID=135651 RepID=G0MKC5_CAEBE|nr:hypothetical protein CAEBREN_18170 [Caenorhabditis brenneri]